MVVAHTYNLSIGEFETGVLPQVQENLGYIENTTSNKFKENKQFFKLSKKTTKTKTSVSKRRKCYCLNGRELQPSSEVPRGYSASQVCVQAPPMQGASHPSGVLNTAVRRKPEIA